VRELDRATPQAANALLKTLEEPPPRVLLLLTASQREALLPTVISRCQVLTLRPLPVDIVEAALQERWRVAPERAALLARLSNGCLGVAVAALDDARGDAWRCRCLEEIAQIVAENYGARLQRAEQLSQEAEMVRPTLVLWLSWWRDVMLAQAQCEEQLVNIDQRHAIEAAAQRWTAEQVRETVRRLRDTLQYVDANANVRLALETLVLSLPQPLAR
jgi:DNA polymerase-3 subunit delta'